jgi:hypothetical protein
MTPFQKFLRGLQGARMDLAETFEELIAFAEIMSRKSNSVELDENGFFYVTAAGPLEEIIPTMKKQLAKLERIQAQKGIS